MASVAGSSSSPAAPAAVSETSSDLAMEWKGKGNSLYKEGHFQQAIECYSKSIDAKPTAPVYGNRSMCNLKLEAFGSAIADADCALALDAGYLKAYYRKGSAYLALAKYKDARKCFRAVVARIPGDADAKERLAEADKQVKRAAFEKAIRTEHTMDVFEKLASKEPDAVPSSYDGPRLPDDGTVTLEFVDELLEYQRKQKNLHRRYAVQILQQAYKLFHDLPTLIRIEHPSSASGADASEGKREEGEEEALVELKTKGKKRFNVCGDTHGQYYDLLELFKINGKPSKSNPYLFNGDYVDRGSFSVENILALLSFKLALPEHFHMLRGNHESKQMTQVYGFQGEVVHKYDKDVMELFLSLFQQLPLAACIGGKVLVVHGGIFAEDGVTLADIEKTNRFRESPEGGGIMSDIMWADPQPFPGRGPSKRGVGKQFGPDVTKAFLEANGLELLIRSHEVKDEGYLVEHGGKCITVFSAPNYCDQMGNKGAIVHLDEDCKPTFTQFSAVSHPPIRPMAYAAGMQRMFM